MYKEASVLRGENHLETEEPRCIESLRSAGWSLLSAKDEDGINRALHEIEMGRFDVTGREKLLECARILINHLRNCAADRREYLLNVLIKVCKESRPFVEQVVQVDSIPLALELTRCGDLHIECLALDFFSCFFTTLFSTNMFFETHSLSSVFEMYEELLNTDDSRAVVCKMLHIEDVLNSCFHFFSEWPEEALQSICRLYSMALAKRRVHSYAGIDHFVRNLFRADGDDGLAMLWEFDIPQTLWGVFCEDQFNIYVVNALATICMCESDDLNTRTRELVDLSLVVTAFMTSGDETFIQQALKFLETACLLNPDTFVIITNPEVLEKLRHLLTTGSFETKFGASAVLHAAISSSNVNVVRQIFSSDIMLVTLDCYDIESPRLLAQMLRAASRALDSINKFGIEAYESVNTFEKGFAEVVKGLLVYPDEDVRLIASQLATSNFPDLLAPTAISHSIPDV